MLNYLKPAHKPVPKAFTVSAPSSCSLNDGTRMFVNPDKMSAGVDGHAPMAPDTREGRNDLDRYLFAWGAEGNPQLRGSAKSDPALRQRLVKEGRIILLDRDTRVISIHGGDLSGNDGVYVADGPYEGFRGTVFSTTLRPDQSIFGGVNSQ